MAKDKNKLNHRQTLPANDSIYYIASTMFLLLSGVILYLLNFNSGNKNILLQTNNDNLNKDTSTTSLCMNFFTNQTYNTSKDKLIKTTLIKEHHGKNEYEVVACLDTLLNKDDHMLIEFSSNGNEILCDSVSSAYKKFNGKARCYGADISIDEARRRYSDFAWRANFISQKVSKFFLRNLSSKEIINLLINFADTLRSSKNNDRELDNFNARNGKYLRQLAIKMRGLDIKQLQQYLVKENNIMADKAERYEKLSRSGPTNQALIAHITNHQKQLSATNNNLFVVYGANHLDPENNLALKKLLEQSTEVVTILSPRKK